MAWELGHQLRVEKFLRCHPESPAHKGKVLVPWLRTAGAWRQPAWLNSRVSAVALELSAVWPNSGGRAGFMAPSLRVALAPRRSV